MAVADAFDCAERRYREEEKKYIKV